MLRRRVSLLNFDTSSTTHTKKSLMTPSPTVASVTSPIDNRSHHQIKRTYSIHRVRELKLQEVTLDTDYQLLELIGEGSFGKVHLAEHRQTGSKIALKAVSKEHTRLRDFLREFHYSYFLSPHRNILISYDVAFQTDSYYMFAQEYAPHGDLARLLDDNRSSAASTSTLDETAVKSMCRQVASALEFMHSKDLVHRDVRPHNVLIFDNRADLQTWRVKLTDFGLTRLAGTLVKKTNVCLAYMPPEICDALYNEGFTVETSSDVWQLAVLIYLCLRRRLPWQRADLADPNYTEFVQWQKRKSTKTPTAFRTFSQRLLRMFRRMLDPKQANRASIKELAKYMNDRWLVKGLNVTGCAGSDRAELTNRERASKGIGGGGGGSLTEEGVVNFKSSQTESLGRLLMSYGIETTIDYEAKKKRIRDWVLTTPP